MASRFADRLLTIVITATVTSAAWIVIGSSHVGPGEPAGEEGIGAGPAPAAGATGPGQGSGPDASQSLAGGLGIPVPGVSAAELTNTFAEGRGEGERLHQALDIIAPAGTPVLAAGPGTIERLFVSEAGGNTIYVRSTDRQTLHYYAHLRDYAPAIREGQQVRRGQRLGTVGATGNADAAAPHLHFALLRTAPDAEWWEPATALNPYPLMGGR